MSTSLIICSIGLALLIIATIIYLVIKKRISIKFSIVWIALFLILLLFILIPGLLTFFSDLLGFQTASNMIISILIVILILINISLTVVVTKRGNEINKLTQEIAILINDNKNDK